MRRPRSRRPPTPPSPQPHLGIAIGLLLGSLHRGTPARGARTPHGCTSRGGPRQRGACGALHGGGPSSHALGDGNRGGGRARPHSASPCHIPGGDAAAPARSPAPPPPRRAGRCGCPHALPLLAAGVCTLTRPASCLHAWEQVMFRCVSAGARAPHMRLRSRALTSPSSQQLLPQSISPSRRLPHLNPHCRTPPPNHPCTQTRTRLGMSANAALHLLRRGALEPLSHAPAPLVIQLVGMARRQWFSGGAPVAAEDDSARQAVSARRTPRAVHTRGPHRGAGGWGARVGWLRGRNAPAAAAQRQRSRPPRARSTCAACCTVASSAAGWSSTCSLCARGGGDGQCCASLGLRTEALARTLHWPRSHSPPPPAAPPHPRTPPPTHTGHVGGARAASPAPAAAARV